MDFELTLEEEISLRRETVENALRCVQGFLDSVDFYITKLKLHTSQDPDTFAIDLNQHLFEFVEAEAMRAVEKAAQITQLSSGALLPVTYVDPHSVIMLAVSHLTALQYKACNIVEEDRLINLCHQIRSKASDLHIKPVKRCRTETETLFHQMKQRYYQDNLTSFDCYRQDCENKKSEMMTLRENNLDYIGVQCYIQSEMCITKTLELMIKAGCTEQDLLQLFAYVIRFEILHEDNLSTTKDAFQSDDPLFRQLLPCFYNNPEEVKDFINQIKGAKPMQVTTIVNSFLKRRKISDKSCGVSLWKILHDAGFYAPELRNWHKYIEIK